jgi:hypothetical protein
MPRPTFVTDSSWVDLERIGRKLYVELWGGEKESLYAPLEEYLRAGRNSRTIRGRAAVLKLASRDVDSAETGCAGRCLRAGATTWRLPGRLLRDAPAAPHYIGGEKAYLVPLESAAGARIVIARAGGRVEDGWLADGSSTGFLVLPDGVIWDYAAGRRLAVIEADGRVGRPLPIAHLTRKDGKPAAAYWPQLVRRHAGRSWVAWNGDLLTLDDRGGRVLATHALPENRGVRALSDGLLIPLQSGGAAFMDWEGRVRSLEKGVN